MQVSRLVLALPALVAAAACLDPGEELEVAQERLVPRAEAFDDEDADDDSEEEEQEVPLDLVPQVVEDAALAAVDGLVLSKAELETEDGRQVYSLEGTAYGKDWCVEVTPEGEVVEVEEE